MTAARSVVDQHFGLSPALAGTPVIESRNVPDDYVLSITDTMTGRKSIVVQDGWRQLVWPMFMSDQRQILRAHLVKTVAEAEVRLFGFATRQVCVPHAYAWLVCDCDCTCSVNPWAINIQTGVATQAPHRRECRVLTGQLGDKSKMCRKR